MLAFVAPAAVSRPLPLASPSRSSFRSPFPAARPRFLPRPPRRPLLMSAAADAMPAVLSVLRTYDKPGSLEVRKAARPDHLRWATAAEGSGPSPHVHFGGPLVAPLSHPPSPEGSLLFVTPRPDLRDTVLPADPYVHAGLFDDDRTELRAWQLGMGTFPLPHLTEGHSWFVVWCIDKKAALQSRMETRPKHRQWWKDSGRVGVIGPLLDGFGQDGVYPIGTLIVTQGTYKEDVEQFAKTDPYNEVGLFDRVDVREFKKVIENAQLVT